MAQKKSRGILDALAAAYADLGRRAQEEQAAGADLARTGIGDLGRGMTATGLGETALGGMRYVGAPVSALFSKGLDYANSVGPGIGHAFDVSTLMSPGKDAALGGAAALALAGKLKSVGGTADRALIADRIAKATAENGGHTAHAFTGDVPSDGLMVGIYPNANSRTLVLDGPPTADGISRFIQENEDVLADRKNYVGTWFDKNSGKTYVDVSRRFDPHQRKQAEAFGDKSAQIAGFDLGKMEEFPILRRGYDPEAIARDYPKNAAPTRKVDRKTGREYDAKTLSPEGEAVQRARGVAQAQVDQGNYEPYFDVSQRHHVDPSNYPVAGRTIDEAMPKKPETVQKWSQKYDTKKVRDAYQGAYDEGLKHPEASNWYAMGQLENEYIKQLGPEAGRDAFARDFAHGMAATTGGSTPKDNLATTAWANFTRNKTGQPVPTLSHQIPFPVGGRYIGGNAEQYNKAMAAESGRAPPFDLRDNPKRHNFAANFLGHQDPITIDEQMSTLLPGNVVVPPGDSYGIVERMMADEAAKRGVPGSQFQDVAWRGIKAKKEAAAGKTPTIGKPMIQDVNEMIARTSMLTGLPQDKVLEGFIKKTMPMYAVPGAIGLLEYLQQQQGQQGAQ